MNLLGEDHPTHSGLTPLPDPAQRLQRQLVRVVNVVLTLGLVFLLVIVIPQNVFRDIEAQPLNPAELRAGPELAVYADPQDDLAFGDLAQRMPDQKLPFDGHGWLQQSLVKHPVWVSFPLQWQPDQPAAGPLELFLELGFASFNRVDFYLLDAQGTLLLMQRAGDHLTPAQRVVPLSRPLFHFAVAAEQPLQVVLRLETDADLNSTLILSSAPQMLVSASHQSFLYGVYYGVMATMFFYNLFIYIVVRKRSHLYYVLYVLFVTLYQSVNDGVFHQYLWPYSGWMLDRGMILFGGFANLMALLFVRSLIGLRLYDRRLYRISQWAAAIILLTCLLEIVLASHVSTLLMVASVVLSCLLVPAMGFSAWRAGSPVARHFLAVWFAYPIILLMFLLTMAGFLPSNYATVNSLRLGSMVETILMSLALASYVNHLRKEKINLQRALTEELEQRVAEVARTAFLLSQGDYRQRVAVREQDRLGPLVRDLNRLADELQHLSEERRRWVADISHELRNPLAGLQGIIESLRLGTMPINDRTLMLLQRESQRLDGLVNDLHQLSVAESASLSFFESEVDLVRIIRDVLQLQETRFDAAQLRVEFEPGRSPVTLRGDADRLRQLFNNLAANSLAYTASPGLLRIRLLPGRERLVIEWEDSAPGLPEADFAKVFGRLFRGDRSRSRKTGGSGLGLSICKAVVEGHGGEISASPSTLGGLLIRVILPYRAS